MDRPPNRQVRWQQTELRVCQQTARPVPGHRVQVRTNTWDETSNVYYTNIYIKYTMSDPRMEVCFHPFKHPCLIFHERPGHRVEVQTPEVRRARFIGNRFAHGLPLLIAALSWHFTNIWILTRHMLEVQAS